MSDWQRLSPRMLLVHPVHEVLRQLPVLVGAIFLGSSTGNSAWPLAALSAVVGFGLLRWFFTTYRISDEYVELRTGVLRRRSISVPRNQNSFGTDRLAAAAPAARADRAAGWHRSGVAQ